MKVKFFGGPAHRKKFDVQDYLRVFKLATWERNPNWVVSGSNFTYNTTEYKEHIYYRHDIQGENQTFTIYVHEDSSIDEVLKKALT